MLIPMSCSLFSVTLGFSILLRLLPIDRVTMNSFVRLADTLY